MGFNINQSPWLNRFSIVGHSTTPYTPEKVYPSETSYEASAIRAEAVGIGFSMVRITNHTSHLMDGVTITTELEPSHYSEFFVGVGIGSTHGMNFNDATEVVDYINNVSDVGSLVLPAPRTGGSGLNVSIPSLPVGANDLSVSVSAGSTFEYKVDYVRGGGYFWTAISPWAEVSSNDARCICGVATSVIGNYQWNLEVENFYGITTSIVTVNVVI